MYKKFTLLLIVFLFGFSVFADDSGKYYVTAKQGLNIRSEPKIDGIVIVKMPFGSAIQVLTFSDNEDEIAGNKSKWAKVKYKKYTGWAFGYYLNKNNPKK